MPETQNTPLWKQLLGAATGSVVALFLYGGFVAVSPNFSGLTAYLSSAFEGKIEHMPAYQRSPETIRREAQEYEAVLAERARAATARLQKGEKYFQGGQSLSSSSLSSVTLPVPSVMKEKEEVLQKKSASPKKQGPPRFEKKEEKKGTDKKRKEEKLPDTGVPLWAIGGIALGLAMSLRYRKELLKGVSP